MESTNAPFTSFPPVTSANVGINLHNFYFQLFCQTDMQIQGYTSSRSRITELERRAPLKNGVFLFKSLENWGYDNFFHRNANVSKLWSHDHNYNIIWVTWLNFICDVKVRNDSVITFISKCFYFRKLRVAILLTASKL